MNDAARAGKSVVPLIRESAVRWRIERQGEMRVPGIVFASDALLPYVTSDQSLQQVVNVATLPGIVEASYAMPDVHQGYGFPIGGIAGTDVELGGVVSPGGVGFDISCGVRLLTSNLDHVEVRAKLPALMDRLDDGIPKGRQPGGVWRLSGEDELKQILIEGPRYAVRRGFGVDRDLRRCEDEGTLAGADPDYVSARALMRGLGQVGSLGSGNHFLEIQVVDTVFDRDLAAAFELHRGQVCVMIHSGSRGLGHQVCTDHVKAMDQAMQRLDIRLPDKQLACAPVTSIEGKAYLAAMAAAANYGRTNRQLLTHGARKAFAEATGTGELDLLYDVSHNLAKLEEHAVDGDQRLLCVQRKGATRAFPPGHPDVPPDLRSSGQPVLIPGSMGTASYVLAGVSGSGAFHSTCHGAGRTMSRHAAKRKIHGSKLRSELEAAGISVRAHSLRDLPEEAPFAYKDVDEVVQTCVRAGMCAKVARLRPVGVIKG